MFALNAFLTSLFPKTLFRFRNSTWWKILIKFNLLLLSAAGRNAMLDRNFPMGSYNCWL